MKAAIHRTFDRIAEFDERSRLYWAQRVVAEPVSVLWPCLAYLDQGREGACVGYAISHALACAPAPVPVSESMARNIYHEAQRIDEFPGGSYAGADPYMEGTSVLAGLKSARAMGLVTEYRWGFGLDDLLAGLVIGPAVLGVPWYEGLSRPNASGLIRVSGRQTGGHAICCRGVDVKKKLFTLRQSWGRSFGDDGDCYITFIDMIKLLAANGEACFPVKTRTQ